MEARRSRLPLAILVAVVAAGTATVILRPRTASSSPPRWTWKRTSAPRKSTGLRTSATTQRLLGLGGMALTGGHAHPDRVRPPRRVFDRLARRPLLGGAAAGAGISLALAVVSLPLDAVAHERASDVGLSTQDWGPWAGDVAKSAALSAAFAGGGRGAGAGPRAPLPPALVDPRLGGRGGASAWSRSGSSPWSSIRSSTSSTSSPR